MFNMKWSDAEMKPLANDRVEYTCALHHVVCRTNHEAASSFLFDGPELCVTRFNVSEANHLEAWIYR